MTSATALKRCRGGELDRERVVGEDGRMRLAKDRCCRDRLLLHGGQDRALPRLLELLEREVNPSVASHGGKISVVGVKDATLYIAMSGGCQGCAASQVTLKQGVEVMVRRVAPEIRSIVE